MLLDLALSLSLARSLFLHISVHRRWFKPFHRFAYSAVMVFDFAKKKKREQSSWRAPLPSLWVSYPSPQKPSQRHVARDVTSSQNGPGGTICVPQTNYPSRRRRYSARPVDPVNNSSNSNKLEKNVKQQRGRKWKQKGVVAGQAADGLSGHRVSSIPPFLSSSFEQGGNKARGYLESFLTLFGERHDMCIH